MAPTSPSFPAKGYNGHGLVGCASRFSGAFAAIASSAGLGACSRAEIITGRSYIWLNRPSDRILYEIVVSPSDVGRQFGEPHQARPYALAKLLGAVLEGVQRA